MQAYIVVRVDDYNRSVIVGGFENRTDALNYAAELDVAEERDKVVVDARHRVIETPILNRETARYAIAGAHGANRPGG